MTDIFTKKKRSEVMSLIRPKGTSIEKLVGGFLKKEKIRFKAHHRIAGGRPDICLPDKRIAVFVDGDFWHGWQFPRWKKKLPRIYWQEKISKNIARDRRYLARLRRHGWKVIRVWEHQLTPKAREKTLRDLLENLKKSL